MDVVASWACVPLVILACVPRTRAMACLGTAALMVASVVASYVSGGLESFWYVLPFDLFACVAALATALLHVRADALFKARGEEGWL